MGIKFEGKVQELQSRLDAELDARDRISQSSQSVQSKITQLEKQVGELTDQLRVESEAHAKLKKSNSDLQKVCMVVMVFLLKILYNNYKVLKTHTDMLMYNVMSFCFFYF